MSKYGLITAKDERLREYSPPPGMQKVRIFDEVLNIWPEHCKRGLNCFQCFIEGKMQCDPKYWRDK